MEQQIPMRKRITLEERITIPVDKETHHFLSIIKSAHGVDTMEWLRQIIKAEIPKIKEHLKI